MNMFVLFVIIFLELGGLLNMLNSKNILDLFDIIDNCNSTELKQITFICMDSFRVKYCEFLERKAKETFSSHAETSDKVFVSKTQDYSNSEIDLFIKNNINNMEGV